MTREKTAAEKIYRVRYPDTTGVHRIFKYFWCPYDPQRFPDRDGKRLASETDVSFIFSIRSYGSEKDPRIPSAFPIRLVRVYGGPWLLAGIHGGQT